MINSGGWSGKKRLIIISLIVSAIIIIWLLFFSSLFKINNIIVTGVDDSTANEVKLLAQSIAQNGLLSKNNLLFYNKSELKDSLNKKYYLSSLTVKRKLFHTLAINLNQEQQAAIWLEQEKYYSIDSAGNIISQVDPLNISRQAMPLIENQTNINIAGRQANINKTTLDIITGFFQEFKDKKHNFELEKFILDNSVNTIKMQIIGGPKIFFNTSETIGRQAAALDLVIKEKLKDKFNTKEYIDLRYGNNIYIK